MKILFVSQRKGTPLCSSTAYTQVCTKSCLGLWSAIPGYSTGGLLVPSWCSSSEFLTQPWAARPPLAHLLWLWCFLVHRREFFSYESLQCNECFTVSCFAPGSQCLCRGWGTDDTKVLAENHHVYLSSKTSLCASVKSLFYKIETYLSARFLMSCICIGDKITSQDFFFKTYINYLL